jgi:hypothetical protein
VEGGRQRQRESEEEGRGTEEVEGSEGGPRQLRVGVRRGGGGLGNK